LENTRWSGVDRVAAEALVNGDGRESGQMVKLGDGAEVMIMKLLMQWFTG
jgi:hypothetical protein